MKITKLTLIHDFKYEVYFFKYTRSAQAFLKRNKGDDYRQETIKFNQPNKIVYSVRSVGNFARVAGLYSNLKDAKKHSHEEGTYRPGSHSDIHSYQIINSYKKAKGLKIKFIKDYSRNALV